MSQIVTFTASVLHQTGGKMKAILALIATLAASFGAGIGAFYLATAAGASSDVGFVCDGVAAFVVAFAGIRLIVLPEFF